MGNRTSGPRLLGNGKYSSYHIKLEKAATISVKKEEDGHGRSKWWELTYDVDGMISKLSMYRINERNLDGDEICISVEDFSPNPCGTISITVKKEKKKSGLLCTGLEMNDIELYFTPGGTRDYGVSLRGEVETHCWAYGWRTRMNLLVMEKKKKSNVERPYMVTVAHYYVNSGGGGSGGGGSGVNIGFSMVVKIGVVPHNGQLDISVDGPVEHPSSALLYMIEEVGQTWTWKPSACPHCRNIQCLSKSEDSDTPLPPPPPPSYGGQQNATNDGWFNGDGNGSIFQAKNINFNNKKYKRPK